MKKPKTFFEDEFHAGDDVRFAVVARDYPCEYSLTHYLAAATVGEEVAVGYLVLREEMTEDEVEETWPGLPYCGSAEAHHYYEVPLVIVPGVGVWICEPVFGSASRALEGVAECADALERALGRSVDELPIGIALFAMDDDPRPDLRGVDPLLYFDAASYQNLAESLGNRRSREWPPHQIDDVIRELLELGDWLDSKEPERLGEWPVPKWLADVKELPVAA